jgi:CBS domain-containing protein
MQLRQILVDKGNDVHTIRSNASLEDVVRQLVMHNIGSLVVTDPAWPSRMVGIVTERDVLRAVAQMHIPLHLIEVADTMTRKVVCASPDDSVEDAMQTITECRVRHLPVVQEGELLGMVSIGDLVKSHSEELAVENHYLKSYLQST